ncbi:response regulator [Alkalihalobacillus oceani]|uniref:Response regulator n=1 Tax=Halalkalibacter oceani TaxID=1653776 RepID=A0A9X2INB0_9BACI|nr:response regulator [Halalkalibacter oceani]
MDVILIDDEHLPLRQLKKMLESEFEGINVLKTYLNVHQALEEVSTLNPDSVFLDIHMPEINGLELAAHIQEVHPAVEIVFVTGYDRYAIEAFELFAFDYLLKPLRLPRLKKTIQRLRQKIETSPEQQKEGVMLRCFGPLTVQAPGQERKQMKWRTAKAQELFAFLLHHHGKYVERGTLLDLLWPDFDVDRALQQLYTTVYHIRQALQQAGLTEITIRSGRELGGSYRLELGGSIQLDYLEWEEQLKRIKEPAPHTIRDYEKLLFAYEEDYLGVYDYMWAEAKREKLRRLWRQNYEKMIRYYEEKGDYEAAIPLAERMQELFPLEEDSYFELMRCYDAVGSETDVEEQYQLLLSRFKRELELQPSEVVLVWYKQWKQIRQSNTR